MKYDFSVIGLGLTGQSVLRFLDSIGAAVIAMDTRREPPVTENKLNQTVQLIKGGIDHACLQTSRKIVLSPGIGKTDLGFDIVEKYGVKIIGDIELFAQYCKAPVIAITGTNGKTTVTTLVVKMLRSGGLKILVGGNIGPPALDLLAEPTPDFYILELSSFQLETTVSLKPNLAAIINFGPDHLDRYESLDHYLMAKLRILQNASVAVINKDEPFLNKIDFEGKTIGFGLEEPQSDEYGVIREKGKRYLSKGNKKFIKSESLQLVGEHNISNVLAALAICDPFIKITDRVIQAILSFRGLPHRSEFVCTSKGITFINDSKATNVGAARAGIKSLMSGKGGVVIVGGVFKGGSIEELVKTIRTTVHTVVLIGRSANYFYESLSGEAFCVRAESMDVAVSAAAEFAKVGEVVLLSPACSSIDMFSNYEARGVAFKEAIKKWEAA